MPGRNGEYDLVAEEGLERDTAMAATRPDDAELELAVRDPIDDRLRVRHRQPDVHVRVSLLELAEKHGHDTPAWARRGAELERPVDHTLVVRRQLLAQLVL